MPEIQKVSATIDLYQASTTVTSDKVTIALGITGNPIRLGTSDVALVTATVTDAHGNPVPNGTPITWFSQKGKLLGDGVVANGVATASLCGIGGSQIQGIGLIKAFVGSNVGSTTYLFVNATNQLAVKWGSPVLAGDKILPGSIAIEQADGSTISYDYVAGTTGSITDGLANARVLVTVGNGNTPAGLLTVTGDDGVPGTTATVTLDAQGKGSFRVQSTGALPSDRGIVLPVSLTYDPPWWAFWFSGPPEAIQTANIALEPAQVIAGTADFVKQLGWGAIAGEGNTGAEIAGDLAFSMIPVVGVYSDIRDMGKELCKLWPGGEDPNWLTFGFAVAGVAGEFFGPVDLIFDVGKQLSKVVRASSPIWLFFLSMAKKGDIDGILKLKPVFTKVITDADFRRLLDGYPGQLDNIAEAGEDFIKVEKLIDGLGADGAASLLKHVDESPELGEALVRRVIDTLGTLSPAQLAAIRDAGKMDQFLDAIKYQIDPDKLQACARYLDDVKVDPAAPLPVFGGSKQERKVAENEAAIDRYLFNKGEKPEPNLLSREHVSGRASKQGDRIIDGEKWEYKTISDITSKDLSGALSTKIVRASDQASRILLDMRVQANFNPEIVERAVVRARGFAEQEGRLIEKVRVIFTDTLEITY